MKAWKTWLNRVVSAIVIVTMLATSTGFLWLQPVEAGRAEPQSQVNVYRPRGREQTSGPPFICYLPVIVRGYVPPASTEITLNPGTGGEIGSSDGKVRIVFDPEAITQTVTIRYREIAPPSLPPDNLGVAGPAFEITAEAADGTPIDKFPYQVTIIPGPPDVSIVTPTWHIYVYYTPEDVDGLDTSLLFLYTRRGESEDWLPTGANYGEQQMIVAENEEVGQFVPMAPLASRPQLSEASLSMAAAQNMKLALDPDDNVGRAYWPGVGTVWEGPYAYRLARDVRQRFIDNNCHVDILITRNASQRQGYVPRSSRARRARNFGADMFVTLAFNALRGHPWGVRNDGGLWAWARDHNHRSNDVALVNKFFSAITTYTSRPHRWGGSHPLLPYAEFYNVAPHYAHIETLFLDHNYDWPVIHTHFDLVVDATYAAIANRLTELGLTCGEDNQPPPIPDPPSPEVLRKLRDLGYQNYQRYGGDPVSFSTGNHVVQVRLARIPGRGGLDFDLTLTYNSQDWRSDLFGYGWSFPYNARAQQYSDDSVSIALADGRTYHYTWNGSGYDAPAGVYDRLTLTDQGWEWTTPDEVTLVFSRTVGGFGILTEQRDRRGNGLHFDYDLSGQDNWQDGEDVPRPPLTAIHDDAGRTITLTSDENSRITRMALWDGRTYTFEYDGDGNLTRIALASDTLRRFQYDSRHRMTKEWDGEGFLFLQNTYDDRDRVVEQIDASGTHSYFAYDPANRITTFTDNLGHQEVYHWDELNRVTQEQDAAGNTVHNEYDADYNLTSRTDANGNVTRYEYDERGNVTARYDPIPAGATYTSDVTRWTYDTHNQVISMTDALGHTWHYEYDEHGNLTRAVAPDGSETQAAYNAWGQPTVITDALGHATRYEYDDYGNLVRTIYPDGTESRSTYDAAGRETTYTDANGHTVTFEYDDRGNITRITDPKGHVSTFEYDLNDLLVRSVDRRGGERLYQYDANLKLTGERDPLGHWTHYTYDQLYRRVAMTGAAGHVTRYEYDDAGRLLAVTEPTGAVTRYEYDANGNVVATIDPLGYRTRMIYDAANRLKYLIDAAGHRTEYCYDAEDQLVRTIGPRGEVTDYTYDALGRLVAVKDPLGNVTRYEYDAVGNRTAQVDPLGHRTDYAYDALDRLTAVMQPILPDGQRPTTQYAYDAVGNTVVITSPNGFATTFTYDENDNAVTITDPLGGVTRYTYDAEDTPVAVTDANGHTVATTYNLAGLPVQFTDALGYTTTMEYDAVYNLVRQVNAQGKATTYDYDPLGRLLKTTDPLGNATEYARDALGRVIAVTDANGHTTGYDYDALGRLIAVTDPLSGTTRYGYDEVGNLTVITDANGSATTFAYNFLNQLKREVNPLGKQWSYAYDAAGRLIRRVDAMWRATYYEYDSNDRLTAVRYGSTPPTLHPVTFTYDLEGNELQMCDGLGCTTYTYDALGRRTTTTDWLGRTITRTYDALGNLTGLTYPNGYAVAYAYNANDWLTTFTDPHGDASTFEYNPLGQVTRILRPNDVASTYTYDDAGRLTGIDHRKLGAAHPQSAYAYAMDKVGNRTQVIETRAAFDGSPTPVVITHTYQYDALDRLVNAATEDPASDTAYTFDAVGNRLTKTGTVLAPDPGLPELPVAPRPEAVAYTYNAANQLIRIQEPDRETALDYNGNGDRVRETEILTNGTTLLTDYLYDREDRLVGVTKTMSDSAAITVTMVATYTYDGYGRRVRKAVAYPGGITLTQVITYLYDGLDIIGAQLAVSGTVTETYYYLAPSPLTGLRRPFEMERLPNPATGFAGDRYWYEYDGSDSVAGLADENGDLVRPYLYDEYGFPLVANWELQFFAYVGLGYDVEAGLYSSPWGYYDPVRGAYWSTRHQNRPIPLTDPIGLLMGLLPLLQMTVVVTGKRRKRSRILLIVSLTMVILIMAVLAGCDNGGNNYTPEETPTSIEPTPGLGSTSTSTSSSSSSSTPSPNQSGDGAQGYGEEKTPTPDNGDRCGYYSGDGDPGYVLNQGKIDWPSYWKEANAYARERQRQYSPQEIMLAKAIWAEQRGKNSNRDARRRAMRAIGYVIVHRRDSSDFPNTIQGVLDQPHQFQGYEEWKTKDVTEDYLVHKKGQAGLGWESPDRQSWFEALDIARGILNGCEPDQFPEALYFGHGSDIYQRMMDKAKSDSDFKHWSVEGTNLYLSNKWYGP